MNKNKAERFKISPDGQTAVDEAMKGPWSPDQRERDRGRSNKKENDPLSDAHSQHAAQGKKKLKQSEQKLLYQGQSVGFMGNMAGSMREIALGSTSNDDYYADCIEFIEVDYDKNNR